MEPYRINLVNFTYLITKWRKLIILNFLIFCIIAVVISLLLPNWYTAQSSILPPSESMGSGLDLFSSFTEMPLNFSLPGLPGVSGPSFVYAAILQSRTVEEEIVRKYNLMERFETTFFDDAVKILDGMINVDVSEANIITVQVTTKDPVLSASIANSLLEELDKVNKEKRITSAKLTREFIEKRVEETEEDMEEAATKLKEFQEKYKAVSVEEQVAAQIEIIAALRSEIALKEVEYNLNLKSMNKSHPSMVQLYNNIQELKKQVDKIEKGINLDKDSYILPFSEIPDLSYQMSFLLKDREVLTAVYKLLVQQLEQAKIQEKKDTPTIQVLDRAQPPERKSKPKRSLIVILAGIISLFFSGFYMVINEYSSFVKKHDPERYEKLSYIGRSIKNDLYTITRIPFFKRKQTQ